MLQEIVFAGIGGQGIQSMGTLLAAAADAEGWEVAFRPAYVGLMRGGISNCSVFISDSFIAAPVVTQFDVVTVLTEPALREFEAKVKPGGILIWESTNIKQPPTRTDIRCFALPAYDRAANELKNTKVVNMIALGALIGVNPVVKIESLIEGLPQILPPRHHHLIPLNTKALRLGMASTTMASTT